jgi:hypothetical protein
MHRYECLALTILALGAWLLWDLNRPSRSTASNNSTR